MAPPMGGKDVELQRHSMPLEPAIAERLIHRFQNFLRDGTIGDSSQIVGSTQLISLEILLAETASAIRFRAKWFTPEALTSVLLLALESAESSSASATLYASLTLIDTITIYSFIPDHCLTHVTRFIAYAYYQGSRANRLRKLTEEAWSVSSHILESHLGQQFVDALLDIIHDEIRRLGLKIGFARTSGTLMIVRDHLLIQEHSRSRLEITPLLQSLNGEALAYDAVVQGDISDLLKKILTNIDIVDDLDQDGGWDVMIEVVQRCVSVLKDKGTADVLVDCLARWSSTLEQRQLPAIARLFVDFGRPLTPILSKEMLLYWHKLLPKSGWSDDLNSVFKLLCSSLSYLTELRSIAKRTLEVFQLNSQSTTLRNFIASYILRMRASNTVAPAAVIMGEELASLFETAMDEQWPYLQRIVVFEALCEVADMSADAARMLFRLRSDVTGANYFQAGPMVPSTHPGTASTNILYDAWQLPINKWLDVVLRVAQIGTKIWDTYDTYLTHLPSLLGNHKMFEHREDLIVSLTRAVCSKINSGQLTEPPAETNLAKSYVLNGQIQLLTALTSYHRVLNKSDIVSLVSIFNSTAGSGDHVLSRNCIHALTICCYEVPEIMSSYMDDVIDKMSKMVTQRFLAIHVLQFLAGLSRLPELYNNFTQWDYKKIFGVCQSYLQSTGGQNRPIERTRTPTSENSSALHSEEALPDYVYALAHHVATFWYMAMKVQDRAGLKRYITACLTYKLADGNDVIEDQGMVTIDMMDRIDAESGYDVSPAYFSPTDGPTIVRNRLVGLLLVTTETSTLSAKTIVTVRRASGNAQRTLVRHSTEPDRPMAARISVDSSDSEYLTVLPDDILGIKYGRILTPKSSSVLGSIDVIELPHDDAATRAVEAIDRTPALDSHKAGVIYIGEGQTDEETILQNVSGSPDFKEFISDLGERRRLKDAPFNTQGLDRVNDNDGEFVTLWHNEVTEVVFHITTMMPNSSNVAASIVRKKSHIGNNYVNIIFNNSGARLTYESLYNIFPGAFGYVYIVITPSARASFVETRTGPPSSVRRNRFYKVQVLAKPDYPNVSPAAEEKVVSGASLPGFVRNLALNDCIISLMKSPTSEVGEYPSSWRNRLQQIRRIGDRYRTKAFQSM